LQKHYLRGVGKRRLEKWSNAAVAVQTALSTENMEQQAAEPMPFRIGVYVGDVVFAFIPSNRTGSPWYPAEIPSKFGNIRNKSPSIDVDLTLIDHASPVDRA
jgi:hypothetical protein